MATGKTDKTDRPDLDEVNKRAAEAGVAACRPSNGKTRERGRLADAKTADK